MENKEKPIPFFKRVKDIEKRLDKLEAKINTILLVLKSRG